MPSVRKNESAHRYEVLLDDGTVAGFAEYQERGNQVVMPHTEVNPQYNGQGLGSILALAALEDVKASSRCVVPRCEFIRKFIERHAEWQTLVCPV